MIKISKLAFADSFAVRFRTLPLKLESSIPSAVADFASACTYLCSKKCLVLIFMFVLSLKNKIKNLKTMINKPKTHCFGIDCNVFYSSSV